MNQLAITEKRYKEIMGRRTSHKHNYDFGYPILAQDTSYATYYCTCGDSHAVGDDTEMTIEEARDLADWSYR